jgi:hypothetical protein
MENPEQAPKLDGPEMYHHGLVLLGEATATTNEYTQREAFANAGVFFAGAQAAALAQITAEGGIGDLRERRWQAALAGEPLPGPEQENAPQEGAPE